MSRPQSMVHLGFISQIFEHKTLNSNIETFREFEMILIGFKVPDGRAAN